MSSTAGGNVRRPNLRRYASTSAIMAGRVHCRCHLVRWPPPGHPRSCYRGRPVAPARRVMGVSHLRRLRCGVPDLLLGHPPTRHGSAGGP